MTSAARLTTSCARAGHGCQELSKVPEEVLRLLHYDTNSVAPVLPSSVRCKHEEILETNVIEVIMAMYDVMGKIEEQVTSSGLCQTQNHSAVEEIENEASIL